MRVSFPLVVVALTCGAAFSQSSSQNADRDFSGRWFLNPAKSEIHALPEPPDPILKIEQQAAAIHLYRVAESTRNAEEIRTYATDGQETKRRVGQTTLSSQTKWEGAALLINTNVSSPRESYSLADRWKRSRDGNRLTITRSVTRRDGESESVLVYEREVKPAAPPSLVVADARPPADVKPAAPSEEPVLRVAPRTDPPPAPLDFTVAEGTKLPLRLINSVNTKYSSPGDRVYLETVYPILSHGRVIIPPGSYVIGSLTEVKRAGRVKGKSEFYLRFDSLTLPNGTTRDFRSRMSNMDGNGKGTFDRAEGKVQGDAGKGNDTKTVATATAAGTGIGAIAGSAAGHLGMGAGIGAAAGALGGLASVLATRGPDAVLEKGSTVEMVLDRQLTFTQDELRSH